MDEKEKDENEVTKPLVEKKVKKAEKVLVEVKHIQSKGLSVLVEYQDEGQPKRCYIPEDAIEFQPYPLPALVNLSDLHAGIPHGVNWEEFEFPPIDPAEFCVMLRQAGFWTLSDLQKDPRKLSTTLLSICGLGRKSLMEFARNEEKNQ